MGGSLATTVRRPMLRFRRTTLEAIHEHARQAYPEECCGFVLVDEGNERVRRVTNIQDHVHHSNPTRFRRDAKKAYFMDPKELLEVYGEVDSGASEIKAVYHSHPDRDAHFSPEDRKLALFDAEPVDPEWVHLVVSIYGREVRATRAFEWDDEECDFVEVRMAAPQLGSVEDSGARR